MTIRDYDKTPGNNTTLESSGLSDSMLANSVDKAIRDLMADSAQFLEDSATPTSTTGSANTDILATTGGVTALACNVRVVFRANVSNTGASTINVDSLGASDLKVYT